MVNRFLMLIAVVAVLGCSTTELTRSDGDAESSRFSFRWDPRSRAAAEQLSYENVLNLLDGPKPILALYREDLTHDGVVDFFVNLTGSEEIALPILYYADKADISLSLVFSLAWVESRFSPVAVNRNATSVDRGLFQLNSRTFQSLSEEDFFHPDTNTYHAMDYLSWCLQHTTSEEQAVAVYNAGLRRVRAGQTPQSTRIYVGRIVTFREQLERDFRRYMLSAYPSRV